MSKDFEDLPFGSLSENNIKNYFNNVYTIYSAPVDIVDDVINGQTTQVMRMTHWANDVWHGHTSVVPVGGPYDELYLSYNWKFGEDFNSTHGGKLPGIESHPRDLVQGPDCPREGYGFICKINYSEANKIFTYHYDRTDHGWSGCPWGYTEYHHHPIYFNNGTWYNVTQRIVPNSFTNGVGNSDGIFEVWVDGMMVYQLDNLILLNSETPDIRANGFSISSFYGGSGFNYTPQNECYTYIDNISVYIPNEDPVSGHQLHDPADRFEFPGQITDRRNYVDELITQSGTLSNSQWGGTYSSCIDEAYLIDAGEGNRVIYQLDNYQIGSGDYLFFYDGNTSDSERIKLIKGYSYGGDEVIESSGRYLFVRLSVDTDGGARGFSGQVSLPDEGGGGPDIDPPSIPTGLHTTDINVTTLDLSWNHSDDNRAVTGYRVYSDGALDGSTTTSSYHMTLLTAQTTYDISISAFDAASNESAKTPIISVTTLEADEQPPSVPTGLAVTGTAGNSVDLVWNDATDNVAVAGYKVFVDGSYHDQTSDNSFRVSGLNSNTSYVFTVSAFDVVPNESDQSLPIIGTTGNPDNEPPTKPTEVTAVSITSHSISIVWNISTDNVKVDGYHIYANGLLKGTAFTNSFTITQLNPGITYDITVSAYDASSNESLKSDVISEQTVNPDQTLDPTMPEVSTVSVKKSTYSVTTTSQMTSLGHTDIEDYGVLYSKVLEKLESGQVAYGEPSKDSVAHDTRVKEGLILLYDFSEGRGSQIIDRSDFGDPFNLRINKPLNTYWLPGQGLKVAGNTMIYSEEAPDHLFNEIASTDEMTLEAWIIPAELNQSGPARIVSVSTGNDSRAFTLGQEGNVTDFEYAIRVSTTTSSQNGLPEVLTDHDFFSLGLHHVVYTREKNGEEVLYVNGKQKYTGDRPGELGLWAESNRFLLANEMTEERPWNGTYYLVAVYNRALEEGEVEENYSAGFGKIHFTANLESLETNTSYYMSPFVRTDQGIVYGEVKSFMIQNILHFGEQDSFEFDMAVVPNPSDGYFEITAEDSSNVEQTAFLRIADMSGQIIYADNIDLGDHPISFKKNYDLTGFMRNGIYSVIVLLGTKSKAQRLVINKD